MTNFEKVIDFNTQFGIKVNYTEQFDIFDKDPKCVAYRMSLIHEELQELENSITQKDFIETIDALGDLLYVVYGMGATIGSNLDKQFYQTYGKCASNYETTKLLVKQSPKLLKNYFSDQQLTTELITPIRQIKKKLEQDVESKNFKAVQQDLTEFLFNLYSMGIRLGIDMDVVYNLVHSSNMTKLCNTEQEAKDTVEWYKINETRYDTPDYRKSNDNNYYVVYNKSTCKILKSIYYKPVDFKKMV